MTGAQKVIFLIDSCDQFENCGVCPLGKIDRGEVSCDSWMRHNPDKAAELLHIYDDAEKCDNSNKIC